MTVCEYRYNPPATPVPAGAAAEEKSALLHSTIVSVWKKIVFVFSYRSIFQWSNLPYNKLFSSSEQG